MNVLISGQAGTAAIIQGNEARVVRIDDKDNEKITPVNLLYRYFMGATDVSEFKIASESLVYEQLELSWKFDRALQLLLILLDKNEDVETSSMAVECLRDFFESNDVLEYVNSSLYASPLPQNADLEKAFNFAVDKERILLLLEDLKKYQKEIQKYSHAWDSISTEIFGSLDSKNEFKRKMIMNGTFKDFVRAGNDRGMFGNAQFNALLSLRQTKNYRQVLNAWLEGLKPEHEQTPRIEFELPTNIGDFEQVNDVLLKEQKSDYEVFTNVKKQKEGIVQNIRGNNLDLARRFIDDLIDTQKKYSEPTHIAKSLCDLAQEAKNVYNYSFQLELAQRAVSIAPGDGWSHGQLADAYLCLHKYSEALESFSDALSCGEERFGLLGCAKILLEQGNYEAAFDAYYSLREKFSEHSIVWASFAEVLRRMWWLDDALQAYEEAIKRFPEDSVSKCGRAATLTDMGRLDGAIEAYDECIRKLGENEVAVNGKGTVLRKKGEHKAALKLYIEAIKKDKNSYALQYGYAKTLDDSGDFENALKEYDKLCLKYPFEPRAWMAKAELYKATRRFEEAIKLYDDVVDKFPFNQNIKNGRVSVYKKQGLYKLALQTYEINLSKAPYDMIAKAGRADLLKELGEFDTSLKLYGELIKSCPNKRAYQHTKASIHIALGQFDEAEKLLSNIEKPSTQDDWMAYHVKGMLLLKKDTNKIDEVISMFEYALKNCPFNKSLFYFQNALAVAKIKTHEYKTALRLLSDNNTPFRNVLSLHALGELAKNDKSNFEKAEIARECLDVDCPPYLIPLMVELEFRYFKNSEDCKHDEEWIYQQECNSGVLSLI